MHVKIALKPLARGLVDPIVPAVATGRSVVERMRSRRAAIAAARTRLRGVAQARGINVPALLALARARHQCQPR